MYDLEKTIKSILTVYYSRHDIPVSLDIMAETSYFDPNKFEIVIAKANILNKLSNTNGIDETLVRSVVYHELAHAMWTPYNLFTMEYDVLTNMYRTNMINKPLLNVCNIINIVEDELNERFGEHVFLQVDFKGSVLKVNSLTSYDGLEDTIKWKAFESVMYAFTRFHKGGSTFNKLFASLFESKWVKDKITFSNNINSTPSFGWTLNEFIRLNYLAWLLTGYVRFNSYYFPKTPQEFQNMLNNTIINDYTKMFNYSKKESHQLISVYDKVLNFIISNQWNPTIPPVDTNGQAKPAMNGSGNATDESNGNQDDESDDNTDESADESDDDTNDESNMQSTNSSGDFTEADLNKALSNSADQAKQSMVDSLDKAICVAEHSDFYDVVSKAIVKSKGYNKSKEQGGGLGYSGRLNVNRLAHNTLKPVNDWRVFDKGNRSGKADKKINKFYVTLYLDISGSYSSNVAATNKVLTAMRNIEKAYPDNFEFDIVKLGDQDYRLNANRNDSYSIIMPKDKRFSLAQDGTCIAIDAEKAITHLYKKANPDAKKIFIMLIDGTYWSPNITPTESSGDNLCAKSLFKQIKQLYKDDRFVIADGAAARLMRSDGYDGQIQVPHDDADYPKMLDAILSKFLAKTMS